MSTGEHGLTLILGGARSGKSAYAVELARRMDVPTTYVATAEAIGAEMAERIRQHQRDRPASWRTLEEPLAIAERIASEVERESAVIVDCLTVWLGNLMEKYVHKADILTERGVAQTRRRTLEELARLCQLPGQRQFQLLVVSNQVGAGLVPLSPLGRAYRALLGEANQFVARHANKVLLMVAGIPVDVKALAQQPDKPQP